MKNNDINQDRIAQLTTYSYVNGNICYKISRDQRINSNHALQFAIELAKQYKVKLICCFVLEQEFLNASDGIFQYMLAGLNDTKQRLAELNIPFIFLKGKHAEVLPEFIKLNNIGMLITDFDPLKIKRRWNSEIDEVIQIPHFEVDTHNIVPCRVASNKLEFAAYTIRPKILKVLHNYLNPLPEIDYCSFNDNFVPIVPDSMNAEEYLIKNYAGKFDFYPSEKAAFQTLENFINKRLEYYATKRNYPELRYCSDLSPYLHFGKISSLQIALEIMKHCDQAGILPFEDANTASFLEELIVRKELSDNFCFYNQNYDNFDGFPNWAKMSLDEHRSDLRENIYDYAQLESAKSHDVLWNAAQNEMLNTGKMSGYMRMYWAKKILEWTPNPETAQQYAIMLNDTYSIDGRDPNGYAGIAWSIGGVHDRAWFNRAIFGKVRFMSYNSTSKKFDAKAYIRLNSL